ncbi:MAG: Hsp20 family protein [Desulfobacteraceae bacterium]
MHNDKFEATFDKGILKVTIPKKEEPKYKEIEIKESFSWKVLSEV